MRVFTFIYPPILVDVCIATAHACVYFVCSRVYNINMKKRINISIDENAITILESQENKSKYVEDLILNKGNKNSMLISIEALIEEKLAEFSKLIIEQLNKNNSISTTTQAPEENTLYSDF